MTDELKDVRNDLDGEWQLKQGRTGKWFPPNNRLVQLRKEDLLREYYLSEDDYEQLFK